MRLAMIVPVVLVLAAGCVDEERVPTVPRAIAPPAAASSAGVKPSFDNVGSGATFAGGDLFFDAFDSGPNPAWKNELGGWVVRDGAYHATGENTHYVRSTVAGLQLTDFVVEVDWRQMQNGGIWLRYTPDLSGVFFVSVGTHMYWHTWQGGNISAPLNLVSVSFKGQNVRVRITVEGNEYKAFVNGSTTPVTTLTTSAFPSGTVGLYENGYPRGIQTFDNFRVSPIAPPPPSLFFDAFDSGPNPAWKNELGGWVVRDGAYHATGENTHYVRSTVAGLQLTDFVVEVDWRQMQNGGIWLRYTPDLSGVLFVSNGTQAYWHTWQRGNISSPINLVPISLKEQNVRVRITVEGDQYKAFLNGSSTPVTTLTTSAFPSGTVGLYDNGYPRGGQRFDNIRISPVEPPVWDPTRLTSENCTASPPAGIVVRHALRVTPAPEKIDMETSVNVEAPFFPEDSGVIGVFYCWRDPSGSLASHGFTARTPGAPSAGASLTTGHSPAGIRAAGEWKVLTQYLKSDGTIARFDAVSFTVRPGPKTANIAIQISNLRLGASVTSGPSADGRSIGCKVDGNRLDHAGLLFTDGLCELTFWVGSTVELQASGADLLFWIVDEKRGCDSVDKERQTCTIFVDAAHTVRADFR